MRTRLLALSLGLVVALLFTAEAQVSNPNLQVQTPNLQIQPQINPAVTKAVCLAKCQKTFDDCSKADSSSTACSRAFGSCKLGCERQPAPSN